MLRGLANLTAGAFILGQFVGQQRPSVWMIATGFAIWLGLLGVVLVLAKD